ncbi:MAG: pilus assembly protein TadG-related protein [Candidatus Rokuibacteriota bacterium]
MRRQRLQNERGTVLLFVATLLVCLFILAGMAIDVSYLAAARQELRRSTDAAALAGAGKLGFDTSFFPTARQFAQQFASLNPHRKPSGGTITLDLNTANDPAGNIVLGVWDATKPPAERFTPSLDGSQVNAVLCQYSTTIPTSFLNLLGFPSLPVQAGAIAIANPPATIPPSACTFPIGSTACAFKDPSGTFTSDGCGTTITLISSSGSDPSVEQPAGTNTGAWVNLNGTGNPSAQDLKNAIEAAANGAGCNGSSLNVGDDIGANNGMVESAFKVLEDAFATKFASSPIYTVKDNQGNVTYEGQGWEVFIPILESECPPKPINGDHKILGWSRMVMTQVVRNKTGSSSRCVVDNPNDLKSKPYCDNPDSLHESARAVFGYFECTKFDDVNPNPTPGPIGALADHVKLVR